MSKPWEETWRYDDRDGEIRNGLGMSDLAIFGEPTTEGNHRLCGDDAALILAAAAPELYRALAAVRVVLDDMAESSTAKITSCDEPAAAGWARDTIPLIDAVLRKARGE